LQPAYGALAAFQKYFEEAQQPKFSYFMDCSEKPGLLDVGSGIVATLGLLRKDPWRRALGRGASLAGRSAP
jgi:hypothetical protein